MASRADRIPPSRHAGCHHGLEVPDLPVTIVDLIDSKKLHQLPGRPDLPGMGMSGHLKIDALPVIFLQNTGLVIHQDSETVFRCIFHYLFQTLPVPVTGILSPDDTDILPCLKHLILQHTDSGFF